jgi:hypothetical protein
MTNQTYNGWKNWQTWNVALWFGSDEGLYLRVIGMGSFNRDRARSFVLEVLPNGTPDMSSAAEYRGVDWSAISADFNEMRGN